MNEKNIRNNEYGNESLKGSFWKKKTTCCFSSLYLNLFINLRFSPQIYLIKLVLLGIRNETNNDFYSKRSGLNSVTSILLRTNLLCFRDVFHWFLFWYRLSNHHLKLFYILFFIDKNWYNILGSFYKLFLVIKHYFWNQ